MIIALVRRLRAWVRAVLQRSVVERDLDDEIRLHLDLETEKLVHRGLTPADARRRALIAFGGVEHVKEAHRDGRGMRWFRDAVADARYALRALRRSPAWAMTAIITLGLGIGATTAIFSVVNTVVLRPLPFADPDRLAMLWEENPDRDWKMQTAAPANYMDWKEQTRSFESMAAILDFTNSLTLTGDGEPQRLSAANVTGGFFSTLGVQPLHGRAFREEETWRTGSSVVMLSHRLWRDRFGGRKDMVGQQLQLGGRNWEVVGVLPPSFRYPGVDPDLWLPTAFPMENRTRVSFRRAHYVRVIARVRPGISMQSANTDLKTVMSRLEKDFPETNTHMGAGLTPLHEFLVGNTRRPLLVLLSAVGVLLLIACANVGNLLLVKSTARQREVAMRMALGASRERLARQAMTESVVLGLIGGAVGLAVSWLGIRALAAIQPAGLLPAGSLVLHSSEILFVLVVSVLCGVLFGVAPAIWNSGRIPNEALKEGGRSGSNSRRMRTWGSALVVSEVALAVLLTLGAGLLVRSYWELQRTDPGFKSDGVMTMALSLPSLRYDSASKITGFYDELVNRVRTLPGVTGAAVVSSLPATSFSWSSDFSVAGRTADAFGTEVVHREVSADYHRVMGVRLLSGRLLTDADRTDAPPAVLINEALARRFFAGENPIGQRVAFDRAPVATSTWRTIVGVVSNERQGGIVNESRPEFMAPYSQELRSSMTLVAKTSGDPAALAVPLRRIVAELDRNLAVTSLRPMSDVRAESISRDRFLTTILLSFATVGLVLAVVGVYGVMAQAARSRTREMGIRIALGASTNGLQWLIVRYGLMLTALGLSIGLVAAAGTTRALTVLLYGVKPLDAPTFVVVPLLLVFATLVASWLPARRASRVDPAVTLRAD